MTQINSLDYKVPTLYDRFYDVLVTEYDWTGTASRQGCDLIMSTFLLYRRMKDINPKLVELHCRLIYKSLPPIMDGSIFISLDRDHICRLLEHDVTSFHLVLKLMTYYLYKTYGYTIHPILRSLFLMGWMGRTRSLTTTNKKVKQLCHVLAIRSRTTAILEDRYTYHVDQLKLGQWLRNIMLACDAESKGASTSEWMDATCQSLAFSANIAMALLLERTSKIPEAKHAATELLVGLTRNLSKGSI